MMGAFAEGSYAEWHDLEIPKGKGKMRVPQKSHAISSRPNDNDLYAGALSDNRDVSVLPNYQPASERPVFEQVQTGPPTTTEWLQAMSGVYADFWAPDAAAKKADAARQNASGQLSALTEHEQRFVAWAGPVKAWLSGRLAKIEDATVTAFFKGEPHIS